MISHWKRSLVATLLIGGSAFAAGPTQPESDAPLKAALAATENRSKALEERIRQLDQTVHELQERLDTLGRREAARTESLGDPNDHPLWP